MAPNGYLTASIGLSDQFLTLVAPVCIIILGSFGKVARVLHIPSGREMVWKQTNYGGMGEKER